MTLSTVESRFAERKQVFSSWISFHATVCRLQSQAVVTSSKTKNFICPSEHRTTAERRSGITSIAAEPRCCHGVALSFAL